MGYGASLMLGWTVLLLWGSRQPVARRDLLLFTLVPVVAGLLLASIGVVQSGAIQIQYIAPLWVFYALLTGLYTAAYRVAVEIDTSGSS
jgi:hypothetical protein